MDNIHSSNMTASSILQSNALKSKEAKKDDSKPTNINDSFVKSSGAEKADFIKKPTVSPEGKKKFTSSVALGTGIGAAVGGVGGAVLGAVIGHSKEMAKIPFTTHSVEYQQPTGATEQTFAGKIPMDHYTTGYYYDCSRETPVKDIYFTNPATDANGKPLMKNDVLVSTGQGTPSVTWTNKSISYKDPTMTYSHSISEDYHYEEQFSHYATRYVDVFSHYETRTEQIYEGTDSNGQAYYRTETTDYPVYTSVPETYAVYKDVKIHDGYYHNFAADYTNKTIGTYDIPKIKWHQDLDWGEIGKNAVKGAVLGTACGAVAGALVAATMNYDVLLGDKVAK